MITRQQAIQNKRSAEFNGEMFYQGAECVRGHNGERYTKSSKCVTCSSITSKKQAEGKKVCTSCGDDFKPRDYDGSMSLARRAMCAPCVHKNHIKSITVNYDSIGRLDKLQALFLRGKLSDVLNGGLQDVA